MKRNGRNSIPCDFLTKTTSTTLVDSRAITIALTVLLSAQLSSQTDIASEYDPCFLRIMLGLPRCMDDNSSNNVTVEYSKYGFCTIHEDYIDLVKNSFTCEDVQRINPECSKNFTVAFEDLKPYVHKQSNDGKVVGVLKRILNELLVKRCCLSCNELEFLPQSTMEEGVKAQFRNQTSSPDILIPIYNGSLPTSILKYIALMPTGKIQLIAKKQRVETEFLMNSLIYSILKTWPLLLMALCMAVCAGTIIWLLDTWRNKGQFPRKFPSGPFEGFWWAYVSMTTVGYGDKTPHTVVARVFAVIWILAGITVFNMFTASLTSVLTSSFNTKPFSVVGEDVGVLKDVYSVTREVRIQYANPIVHRKAEEMKNSLVNGRVAAIALDKPMAMWLMKEYQEQLSTNYEIQLEVGDQSSIGMTTNNKEITEMVGTFLGSHDMTELVQNSLFDLAIPQQTKSSDFESVQPVVSHEHTMFILTMACSIVLTIIFASLGLFLSYKVKKRKTKKTLTPKTPNTVVNMVTETQT